MRVCFLVIALLKFRQLQMPVSIRYHEQAMSLAECVTLHRHGTWLILDHVNKPQQLHPVRSVATDQALKFNCIPHSRKVRLCYPMFIKTFHPYPINALFCLINYNIYVNNNLKTFIRWFLANNNPYSILKKITNDTEIKTCFH